MGREVASGERQEEPAHYNGEGLGGHQVMCLVGGVEGYFCPSGSPLPCLHPILSFTRFS